jgi:plasmid maintenance system antidote protein VapI
LEALEARGAKLSNTALAQRLGMPAMRISRFVNAAKHVLNVDQAAVLVGDETAGTVKLHRELLARQFWVAARSVSGLRRKLPVVPTANGQGFRKS